MTLLTEGLTPTQFNNIMNSNFTEFAIDTGIDPATMITLTALSDYISTINSNFGSSVVGFGSGFANTVNNKFISSISGIHSPYNVTSTWLNDYAQISFTDNTGGVAQHEIWEAKGTGNYILVTTLLAGVTICNNYTWQNASMNFKVRAKIGSSYSNFSPIVNLNTPLVFKTNQATPHAFTIHQLMLSPIFSGKSVTINWGDGNSTVYTNNTGEYDTVTHTYTVAQNPYYIQISGDTNYLYKIEMFLHYNDVYGDLTKWILPPLLVVFHFYSNSFAGDISNWILPPNISLFDIENNLFTGDITNWFLNFPSSMTDFHCGGNNNLTGDLTNMTFPDSMFLFQLMQQSFTGDITNWHWNNGNSLGWLDLREVSKIHGDISSWAIPSGLGSLQFTDSVYKNPNLNITGDLSNWTFPTSMYSSLGFHWDFWGMTGIVGDLSNKIIPIGRPVGTTKSIDFTNCGITKLPSGSFYDTDIYCFSSCKCNSAEIDRILGVIDNYFTGGVVPLVNCVYTLNGTGMGIPSAAGLASKTSILGKYTAAGKTATIAVNS
jgi:hypothetical protein